jgi:phosphate transport system protein
VNLCERTKFLASEPALAGTDDLFHMAKRAQTMVRHALDALVQSDPTLARRVCAADDEIDTLNRKIFAAMQELMHLDPTTIERAVATISVSRHLERIADHATNIAEDVVFMVEGITIRHRDQVSK